MGSDQNRNPSTSQGEAGGSGPDFKAGVMLTQRSDTQGEG